MEIMAHRFRRTDRPLYSPAGLTVGRLDDRTSCPEIKKLWRRQRQLSARCTAAADTAATKVLAQIAKTIEDNSEERLATWKKSVRLRAGAAKWIKQRMGEEEETVVTGELHHATVSLLDDAERMATTLADRWNVGSAHL